MSILILRVGEKKNPPDERLQVPSTRPFPVIKKISLTSLC